MSKDYYHIKANGIRNELKKLRKSVDKLTEVLLLRQTSKHENINERSYNPQYLYLYMLGSEHK